MKSVVVVFPGSNREKDMADAIERVSGARPRLLWHKETELGNPDLIVLPGGFSYGDYLRCGAIAAHSPVMKEVIRLAKSGTPLLAVCNGFQMLVETRLVPGALLRNASLRFICKQVDLRLESASATFTGGMKPGDVIRTPVAHGEGNYVVAPDTLKAMNDNGQIAFRYLEDVNGSVDRIAGVYNETKTILGMMPHPEDATDPDLGNDSAKNFFAGMCAAVAR
ncbi:MAG: phosphoribosylformylglycinamidine synthase subunit PurQ [Rhodospirillales bacterium]|nr:phosphoribosylformylglycinamidine synthase subunit PurQ [Alphaproteobacteria bacterium]MCB9987021.1 phosphoribosylformylglycinamidine synthase subunit PurQ [Rhodospirillales bacterium]USO08573.1 MAG: phosphoribosylformylglycinamidine synthase subunit PurQ [Rhodospirillales bacterium]